MVRFLQYFKIVLHSALSRLNIDLDLNTLFYGLIMFFITLHFGGHGGDKSVENLTKHVNVRKLFNFQKRLFFAKYLIFIDFPSRLSENNSNSSN